MPSGGSNSEVRRAPSKNTSSTPIASFSIKMYDVFVLYIHLILCFPDEFREDSLRLEWVTGSTPMSLSKGKRRQLHVPYTRRDTRLTLKSRYFQCMAALRTAPEAFLRVKTTTIYRKATVVELEVRVHLACSLLSLLSLRRRVEEEADIADPLPVTRYALL